MISCISIICPSAYDDLPRSMIIFPGCGKYFFWQLGVARYLNTCYDQQMVPLFGESAGALTATLMACRVDAQYATETALRLLGESTSIIGIWGPMVRAWLEEILPEEAARFCTNRVHIGIITLRGKIVVSSFDDKKDLIDACLASTHLPWIMDGKVLGRFRGNLCIDGALWPSSLLYRRRLSFNYRQDKRIKTSWWSFLDFMTMCSSSYLYQLTEYGHDYCEKLVMMKEI